jgi:gliding motility-associated-like protein
MKLKFYLLLLPLVLFANSLFSQTINYTDCYIVGFGGPGVQFVPNGKDVNGRTTYAVSGPDGEGTKYVMQYCTTISTGPSTTTAGWGIYPSNGASCLNSTIMYNASNTLTPPPVGVGVWTREPGTTNPCTDNQIVLTVPPILTTSAVTGLTSTTATLAGTIVSVGNTNAAYPSSPAAAITDRGVVYSTTIDPTIASSIKVSSGIGNGSISSDITSLAANTTYYVRAYATSSIGTGYGPNVTFTTAPAIPSLAAASSIGTTGFTVNWGAVTGATSYRLDVSSDNGFSSFVSGFNNATVTGTSWAVTGLSAGTTYYYRMRSVGSATSLSSGTGSQITVPAAPAIPTTSLVSTTGFTLNWTATTGANSYQLDVSTNSGFSSFVTNYNNATVNAITETVSGLTAGITYYYRIRAVNTGGTGAYSTTASQITVPAAPGTPTASTIGTNGFTANWSAVTGATGYELDVSTVNNFASFVGAYNSFPVVGISQAISSLAANTTYYYRVRTVNASGKSTYSGTASQLTAPAVPTINAATGIGSCGFTANWGAVTGATSYRLDVSIVNTFASFLGAFNDFPVSGNLQAITGLSANITYYYRVKSVNAGGLSAYAATASQATDLTATVNAVGNQAVCAGNNTTAINFTGPISGTTFAWTNNNTASGLAASGTGNSIAAFAGANTTGSPIVSTITVTPTANGCAGTPLNFTITVNPVPVLNTVSNQTLCAGAQTTLVTFGATPSTSGMTYSWTNDNTAIGLAASGSSVSTIPAFTATNSTAAAITATITFTGTANGCSTASKTFTITVNPKANITAFTSARAINAIAGAQFTVTPVNTTDGLVPTGTTYTWSVPSYTGSVSGGTASTGTPSSLIQILSNAGASTGTATYSITPTTGGCAGTAFSLVVNVAPNQPPVIVSGNTLAYTEGGTAAAINSSLTVTDPENTSLASASVSIGSFVAGDLLAATVTGTSIVPNYNSSTGVLSLSGTDSKANYQTVLRSVTYSSSSQNPTNFGANTSRTITFGTNDGTASGTATSTINITATNNAPVLATTSILSYTENDAASAINMLITVSDVDNTTLNTAAVSISQNYAIGEDVLSFTNIPATMGNISGNFNSTTGIITLTSASATATLAHWQTALRAVLYANSSNNPTSTARTVIYSINDATLTSAIVNSTINIVPVNDAPVLSGGSTIGYTENASAIAINTGITVNDLDNSTIASATVSISANFNSGQDVISFTNIPASMGNIAGSYDSSLGIMSLTSASASATLAQWQTALQAVQYSNTSDNPSTGSRTLIFVVNDGLSSSNLINSTINITAVNDAPVIAGTSTLNYTENDAASVINASLTISDIDNITLSTASVAINTNFSTGNDQLLFTAVPATMGNISGSYDGATGVMSLSSIGNVATIAQWQAALRSIAYASLSENPIATSKNVNYSISDGALPSSIVNSIINITPVNDAPVLAGTTILSFIENGTAVAANSLITVSDLDHTTLSTAVVAITANFSAGQDVLSFTNNLATMNNIAGNYNNSTGIMALSSAGNTATLAQWQAALRAVLYANSSSNPTTSARTVSFVVNDGTINSNLINSTINITAINNAAVLAGTSTLNYTENDASSVINTNLVVTDIDNTTLVSATVSIGSNFTTGQDILSFTNNPASMGDIAGSYNTTTGVLSLTSTGSSATLAQWETALRSVQYSNTSDNPSTAVRTVTFIVNDGSNNSNLINSTLNVTAVNDGPVLANGTTVSYTENDSATAINTLITLGDFDNTILASATVSLTTNFTTGQDVLSFTNNPATMNNIAGSYNTTTGIMSLTSVGNAATLAQWQAALRAVQYSNSSDNPTTGARSVSYSVNDALLNSNVINSTINIIAVNDAPILAGISSITFIENTAAAAVNTNITIADVDQNTLASATVTITTNFNAGQDLLAFVNNPVTMDNISGSYNSSTGAMTLLSTGNTATLAQWQAALRSIQYVNSSDNPTIAARTVSFVVNDGTNSSNLINSTINITAVNDAPVLSNTSAVTYIENSAAIAVNTAVVVNDLDNITLSSATVTITTNLSTAEDLLSFTNSSAITMGNIAGSYNVGSGQLSLSSVGSTATVAQWQTALRAVQYLNSSETPSTLVRTVTFIVSDGSGGDGTITSTVNITAVNDAPTLAGISNVTFIENSSSMVINPSLVVGDLDHATLQSALVSIANYATGEDVLSFTGNAGTMGNILGSFNSTTGLMSLSSAGSTASLAQWQVALRAVLYHNTSENPSTTTRQITYVVNDGTTASNVITSTVNMTRANDAPIVVNVISNQTATEDVAYSFQFAANTFSDIDGDALSFTAQLGGGGSLPTWLLFDPGTKTFAGTALNEQVGTITIRVIANDGNGGTVSTTFDLVVNNTNDAPTVANAIANQNATEDSLFSFQFAANTFNDVDAGTILTYSAQLSVGGNLPSWLTFNPATRTFIGTPLNENVGTLAIAVTANDANGGTVTNTFNIAVANTNDAPIIANVIAGQAATEDLPFSFQFAANTFTDVDAGDVLTYTARLVGGSSLPSWLTFNSATRTFSGTPNGSAIGTLNIEVTANDGTVAVAISFSLIIDPATRDVTNATYDAISGVLTVTGTYFKTNPSGADIDLTKFTITGEAGVIYTLTSPGVEITNATTFVATLNSADQTALIPLFTKNGLKARNGTSYHMAAAVNWITAATGFADLTGNAITVVNATEIPVLTTTLATDVTPYALTLNGAIDPKLGNITAGAFIVSKNADLSNPITVPALTPASTTITAQMPVTVVSTTLTGLLSNTTYYYQLVATNSAGEGKSTIESVQTLPSVNANLASLVFNNSVVLDPVFITASTNYTAAVGNTITALKVTPTLEEATASIKVNTVSVSNASASSDLPLAVGLNTITVAVTAENQTVSKTYTITVNRRAAQTLTFAPTAIATYGSADFDPGATSTNNGILIVYSSSDLNVATIVAGKIHIVGAGTVTITANQADDVNHDAAPALSQVLTINKAGQAINFSALPNKTYTDAAFNLNATGGNSGNAVTFISSNPSVATITGNTATIVGAGTTDITASQTGNSNYAAAADVVRSLTVDKASATIALSGLAQNFDGTAKAVTATTSPVGLSGVTVTYDGSTTAPTNAGTYAVVASLTNNNYTAVDATGNLTIAGGALQTIAFNTLINKTFGDASFNLNSTGGNSGNAVTFVSSNPSVATITGNTVTIVGAGTTDITASQTGNSNYAAAADVVRSLTVDKASATLSLTNLAQNFDGTAKAVTVITSPVGLSGITVKYDGSTTAPTNAGTYAVAASLINNNYTAINATGSLVIAGGALQTIAFNPLVLKTYGDANFNLNATGGNSGNAVTFASSNLSVATITGNTVTIVGAGTTNITASQTGNGNYAAAADVIRSLTVDKALATLSLTSLAQNFDGTAKAVTVTTSPAGLSGVTVTYDGSTTAPINAGTYAVAASLTNSNYTAVNATGNLVIAGGALQTIAFNTLINRIFGDASFNLNATGGNSGNAVTFVSSNPSVATITGNTVTIVGAGTTNITASQTGNGNYAAAADVIRSLTVDKASATLSLTNLAQNFDGTAKTVTATTSPVGLSGVTVTYDGSTTAPTNAGTYAIVASLTNSNYTAVNATGNLVIVGGALQTIAFNPLVLKTYGDANFNLNATGGNSSNAVTFVSSNPTVATITGNTVTIVGAGTTNIIASQAGNANYAAATDVQQVLTVDKASATISLSGLAQNFDGTVKAVTATTSPAGLSGVTVTYDGSTTAPTNAGTYAVVASLTNSNYTAVNATGNLVITGALQTITFNTLVNRTFGDATFNLSSTGGNSGNAVTFVSSNPSVATITGNIVTIVGAGTTNLTASQIGNSNYAAAADVIRSLTVDKASATISLSGLAQNFDGTAKAVTATTSPAGLSGVTIAYDGSTTAPINAGTYAVVASLTNSNYTAANATGNLVIAGGALQTIAFNTLVNHTFGDASFNLNATGGNSGNAVTFMSSNPSVATITGNMVTIVGAGTANITASQAGNGNYAGAADVQQVLTVDKASATISLSGLAQNFDGTAKAVTATTSPAGLSGVTITYDGSTTAPTNAGVYAIVASLTNSNYTAVNATGNLVITGALQTIAFNTLVNRTFGDANFNLNATGGNSGNAVTFVSSNPTVATITGNTVTIVGAGTTNITASQAGNANYAAATDVQQVLTVDKATATLSLTSLAQVYDGNAKAVVVTTNPVGLSGVTVTYDGSVTQPTDAGTYAVVASLNNPNYTTVNATSSLVIDKAIASISLTGLVQTYDGVAKNVAVTTIPAVLTGLTITYDGSTVLPVNARTYAVVASLNNPNYTANNATGSLVINKGTATITLSNLVQTYDGTPRSVIAVSSPTGLSGVTITYNGNSGIPTAAGSYAVVAGLGNANYTAVNATGTLVIGQQVINVSAVAKSKIYGDVDPALTYASAPALAIGDSFTGTLTRVVGTNAGNYAITQNTLNAGANYSINFVGANFTIAQKALSISADNKSRTFNVANPTLTASYVGFIAGETNSILITQPVITTTALVSSSIGTYPVDVSGAAATNYAISYIAGTLTVTPNSQTITFAALADRLSTDAIFTLNATSNAGLTISYTSSDATIARIINGNQVEILKAGTVIITANQAGNINIAAATPVAQNLKINDNPAPVIAISSSLGISFSKGETTVLTATGALTYVWNDANGIISGQNTDKLIVRPSLNTTYTVTGSNQYGRSSIQTISIAVVENLAVVEVVKGTNIISPNGDGINDQFVIKNIDLYPNNTLTIFDRTGKTLYKVNNYKNDWDATVKGITLEEGTYYYIVEFGDGKTNAKKGFITIVKDR